MDLQEIIDDDITPPELFDLSIEDDFLNVDISFIAIDSSSGDDQGIGEINIFVDNELIIDYVPLPTETFFEFEIPNYWITELGTHDISIEIIDADDDRSNDALSAIFNGEFEVVFEEVRQFVVWEILQLNDKIFEIEQSNDWRHPEDNLKASTKEKLNLLIQMVSTDEFCDAYDKLLHDIKPKLTGLKTNELEESWGNRVFVNPWVVDEDLNEEFRVDCNLILTHIQILINNS